MVCAVDLTMKASPLPPLSSVSDVEMNKAQLACDGGGGLTKSYDVLGLFWYAFKIESKVLLSSPKVTTFKLKLCQEEDI